MLVNQRRLMCPGLRTVGANHAAYPKGRNWSKPTLHVLDALTAIGVPAAVQSAVFWPLIAGSVVATELAAAVSMASAKLVPAGALTAALVAVPLAVSMGK